MDDVHVNRDGSVVCQGILFREVRETEVHIVIEVRSSNSVE